MKIEILWLAVPLIAGTALLARFAAQDFQRAIHSTVIQNWRNGRRKNKA